MAKAAIFFLLMRSPVDGRWRKGEERERGEMKPGRNITPSDRLFVRTAEILQCLLAVSTYIYRN